MILTKVSLDPLQRRFVLTAEAENESPQDIMAQLRLWFIGFAQKDSRLKKKHLTETGNAIAGDILYEKSLPNRALYCEALGLDQNTLKALESELKRLCK